MPDPRLAWKDKNPDLIADPGQTVEGASTGEPNPDPIAELPEQPSTPVIQGRRRGRPPKVAPVIQENQYPVPIEAIWDSVTVLLNNQVGELVEFGKATALQVKFALDRVTGTAFRRLSQERQAKFTALVRFLLQKSDHRIVCPECGEPSLPYFLSTSSGTFQLQHKNAKPTTHVIYGPEKLDFPLLQLIYIQPAEITDTRK